MTKTHIVENDDRVSWDELRPRCGKGKKSYGDDDLREIDEGEAQQLVEDGELCQLCAQLAGVTGGGDSV